MRVNDGSTPNTHSNNKVQVQNEGTIEVNFYTTFRASKSCLNTLFWSFCDSPVNSRSLFHTTVKHLYLAKEIFSSFGFLIFLDLHDRYFREKYRFLSFFDFVFSLDVISRGPEKPKILVLSFLNT